MYCRPSVTDIPIDKVHRDNVKNQNALVGYLENGRKLSCRKKTDTPTSRGIQVGGTGLEPATSSV